MLVARVLSGRSCQRVVRSQLRRYFRARSFLFNGSVEDRIVNGTSGQVVLGQCGAYLYVFSPVLFPMLTVGSDRLAHFSHPLRVRSGFVRRLFDLQVFGVGVLRVLPCLTSHISVFPVIVVEIRSVRCVRVRIVSNYRIQRPTRGFRRFNVYHLMDIFLSFPMVWSAGGSGRRRGGRASGRSRFCQVFLPW